MAVTTTPFEVDPNSQYDPDSRPNQSYNCGPTTVTNIVQFARDIDYPINDTRRLGTSTNYRGTKLAERKLMLQRRGVACSALHLSPTEVKRRLNGRNTLDLALLMGRIPLSIRVRPFTGGHSVQAIAVGIRNGVPGIWVNNPDFHRDRDERARYFYPDWAWIPAYNALGGWVLVPDKDKVIPTRVAYARSCRTTAAVNVRTGPGTQYSRVVTVPAGYGFRSIHLEKAGGAYTVGSTTRRDWLSFSYNGRLVWVARGFVKEI